MRNLWICLSFVAGIMAATWCADLASGQEPSKAGPVAQSGSGRPQQSTDTRKATINNIRIRPAWGNGKVPGGEAKGGLVITDEGMPPLVARSTRHDALAKMKSIHFRPGWNLVERLPNGWSLYVLVRPDADPVYRIIEMNGRVVKKFKARSKTTCWECGVDENGNTHCWKVPCPKIIGPWKLSSKVKR